MPFGLETAFLQSDSNFSFGRTRSHWNSNNEVPGIVDATGRVVARVGDEVEFGAVSVSYAGCHGPHWAEGDNASLLRVTIGWWERTLRLRWQAAIDGSGGDESAGEGA